MAKRLISLGIEQHAVDRGIAEARLCTCGAAKHLAGDENKNVNGAGYRGTKLDVAR